MRAGCSVTSLIKKLDVKPASKLKLINDPAEDLQWLEVGAIRQLCKGKEPHDFIHLFVKNRNVVQTEMKKLLPHLKPTVIIWASWYKKEQWYSCRYNGDR